MEAPLLKLANRNPGFLTGHRQIIAGGPIRQWFLQRNVIVEKSDAGQNLQQHDFTCLFVLLTLAL